METKINYYNSMCSGNNVGPRGECSAWLTGGREGLTKRQWSNSCRANAILEKLVFPLSNSIIIFKNKLQTLCQLIVGCIEILLLIITRHLSSEDHGYPSTFQYPFEMLLNEKHAGSVSLYANNPDKERREMRRMWIGNRIYNITSTIFV